MPHRQENIELRWWNRSEWVGRVLIGLLLVVVITQAPEFYFLLDSLYIDLLVTLMAFCAAAYLAWADIALLHTSIAARLAYAKVERTVYSMPYAAMRITCTSCLTISVLVLIKTGSRS